MGEQDTSRSASLLCGKKNRWKDRSRKRYFIPLLITCLDCARGPARMILHISVKFTHELKGALLHLKIIIAYKIIEDLIRSLFFLFFSFCLSYYSLHFNKEFILEL